MFTRPFLSRCKNKQSKPLARTLALAAAVVATPLFAPVARAYDVSAPAILQDFESSWQTITNRMPDIFAAGYGAVYTPPPSRAESGNQSVGYDVYDRFDLGSPGNPTLYGTAQGLKNMVNAIHTMGGSSYIDLVWNQSGFADSSTTGFAAAGGYPGLALTLQTTDPNSPGYNTQGYNEVDGDYHSAYATGDQDERLAGLVDIAQETNNVFIRQPTVAGPDNIPGPTPGAAPWFYTGLANVPNPANAQYYPDLSLNPIIVYNPNTGQQNIKIYPYNLSNPMAGTPVPENAMGYLMRYAQYLVQVVGTDGFRVDAAKNMPEWVMNYLDQATYRSSFRTLLNGQQENIFSFSEVYDGDPSVLQPYISKTINPNDPGTIGGNRDVLDFPLFFAMQSNLTGNGYQNNWNNVVNASIDLNDDGLHNGSQGVSFVSSQDDGPPALDSVAYAYTLMMPGNAIVYYNGKNFGNNRDFPQNGRGDALGGVYGNAIPTLVDLRNRYGRGDYRQDWLEQNNFAFERQGSALVMLSNRTDAGYDSRTIDVSFAPGTPLIELTGNAHGAVSDPQGNIPQLLVVNADSSSPTGASVNARFLRNSAINLQGQSVFTGDGYLVYGLPTPQGSMNITNVASVIPGQTPNPSDANVPYENGTYVLSNIDVIKGSSFQIQLNTNEVNLLGFYRDHPADGDNALFKVDDGSIILNGDGSLDYTTPGSVEYGFQNFNTVHNPGYFANNGAGGNGSYAQTIDTSQLSQGYHYITIEAFRHRDDGGPPVYSDWKQTIYIDTAPPNSTVLSFNDDKPGVNENRQLEVQSVDGLADNVHTFLDLPFGLTDSQVLAQISSSTQANQLDTNLWEHYYAGVTSGNHTATVVSYKPDGTYNIQRFDAQQDPFLTTSTLYGLGVGDVNFDGQITSADINTFTGIVESNNTQFNPAADVNGDGLVDLADTFLLGPVLSSHNVDQNTWNAYNSFIYGSYVTSGTYNVNGTNVIYQDTAGTTNVTAGSSLNASYVRGNALNIAAGGSVTIAGNATAANGASKVLSLTMAGSPGAWTGKLDLNNNSLIVESSPAADAADLARITDMVRSGYDGGKWDGNGIISSAAASDPLHLHTLGVILNQTSAGAAIYSSLNGLPTDANSILVRYTYYGDADLNGVVNGNDYSLIDHGFAADQANPGSVTGWVNGDFNYDGKIDGSDYSLIDNAFNMQGLSGLTSPLNMIAANTSEIAAPVSPIALTASEIAPASPVPEPGSVSLLILAAAGLLTGRRERKTPGPVGRR